MKLWKIMRELPFLVLALAYLIITIQQLVGWMTETWLAAVYLAGFIPCLLIVFYEATKPTPRFIWYEEVILVSAVFTMATVLINQVHAYLWGNLGYVATIGLTIRLMFLAAADLRTRKTKG